MSYTGKKLSAVTDYLNDYIRENALENGARLPTENELMERTGVSRVTLRRALANMQEERLIYSIQGSGYYVGELRACRTDTIPLVISYDQENSKILNVVHGAQDYLNHRNCKLEVHISRRDPQTEREMITQLYDDGHRCIIVFPVSSEDNVDFYFQMIQKGINFVFIDRRPQSVKCCNFVRADNNTGGYLATKHLIEQGHRNIVVFGLEPLTRTSATFERFFGYQMAMRQFGLPLPAQQYFYAPYRRLTEEVQKILRPENKITAVFAINDHAAVDIATHAINQGLSVPEDLAVIGFDNLDITSIFTPNLSTIDQPFTQLGEKAAELAYKHITNALDGYMQLMLPIRLIVRESTQK